MDIVAYYNKFNEDKRLLSRHGQVEYNTTMHFIHQYIEKLGKEAPAIIDIGAGTGRYSVALADEGYDVTAVELVKYNLGILKKKGSSVKAYQGNALKLKRFSDNSFDFTILLGPLYHLHSFDEQVKALSEAKRVTKSGGYIFAGYVMTDYALVRHGFMDHEIMGSLNRDEIDSDFYIRNNPETLYEYHRLDEIDELNKAAGLTREMIFSPDGPSDYIRHILNAMSEEEFEVFKEYQLKNATRPELVGAGSHTVDILRVG